MRDLVPTWLAVAIFVAAIVAAAAVVLYQRFKKRPQPPVGWTHIGLAPARADRLLELLQVLWPGLRGGTITWVEFPWPDPIEPKWTIVAEVTDHARHGLKIVRGPGALRRIIHEVDHLRRGSAKEGTDGWVARAEAFVTSTGFDLGD